jgi:protein-tyrosine phosphatase
MPSSVSRVTVATNIDGSLGVCWRVEGEPVDVDIAVGPTPTEIDHAHVCQVPAGESRVRLPAPSHLRPFVSVAPVGGGSAVVAADRRVPFEGVQNFRDLGGYPTASGGHVRWGMVFRADALHGLTEADVRIYDALGCRTVYDLRSDVERAERPNPVASTHLSLIGRLTEDASGLPKSTSTSVTGADGERVLRDLYVGLLTNRACEIGSILTAMSEQAALPVVFHCHAGKDRTGVVAAVLLDALGVDRETVLEDYELTTSYRKREHHESSYQRMVEGGMSPEAAAAVLTTPRWAMEDALCRIDELHGGLTSYLLEAGRMTESALAGLQDLLVVRPPG